MRTKKELAEQLYILNPVDRHYQNAESLYVLGHSLYKQVDPHISEKKGRIIPPREN